VIDVTVFAQLVNSFSTFTELGISSL